MRISKILSAVLLTTSISYADGIKEFANGVIMDTTSSGSMSLRDKTVLYGGGVKIKAPNMTLTPLNIQAPSVKGGCGGIDLAFGSMSFLSADQVVKFMEAIMANAEGVAFDIALKTLCPSCSETLKAMEAMANQINNMSLDSCQSATQLAHMGANMIMGKDWQEQVNSGEQDSWLSATNQALRTGTEYLQKFNTKVNNIGSINYQPMILKYLKRDTSSGLSDLESRSFLGYAISQNGLDTYFKFNIMASLIGDIVIVREPTNQEGSIGYARPKYPVSKVIETDLIVSDATGKTKDFTNTDRIINRMLGAEHDNGTIYIVANNTDYQEVKTSDANFPKGALFQNIQDQLDGIIEKIRNRNKLTDDQLTFLGQFETPVYPIFNTLGANDLTRDILEDVKDELTMMLATQIFYEYVIQINKYINKALADSSTFGDLMASSNYPFFIQGTDGKSNAMRHLNIMAMDARNVASLAYKKYYGAFNNLTKGLKERSELLKELQNIKSFTINRSNPEMLNNLIMNKAITGK